MLTTTNDSTTHREKHLKALRAVLAVMGTLREPIALERLTIEFRRAAIKRSKTAEAFVRELTGFVSMRVFHDALRRTMVNARLVERIGDELRVFPAVIVEVERLPDPLAATQAVTAPPPVPVAPPAAPKPAVRPVAPPVPPSGPTGPYGEDEGEFDPAVLRGVAPVDTLDQFVLLCASPMACWVRADMHQGVSLSTRRPSLRLRAGFPATASLIEELLELGVLINRESRASRPPTYEVQTETIRVLAEQGRVSRWVYEFARERFQTLQAGGEEELGFAPEAKFDEAIRLATATRAAARAARRDLMPRAERQAEIAQHQAIIDALRAQDQVDDRTAAELLLLESLPRLLASCKLGPKIRTEANIASVVDDERHRLGEVAASVGLTRNELIARMHAADDPAKG